MDREGEQPADELRLCLARSERERVSEQWLEVLRWEVEMGRNGFGRWVERQRWT